MSTTRRYSKAKLSGFINDRLLRDSFAAVPLCELDPLSQIHVLKETSKPSYLLRSFKKRLSTSEQACQIKQQVAKEQVAAFKKRFVHARLPEFLFIHKVEDPVDTALLLKQFNSKQYTVEQDSLQLQQLQKMVQ